MNHEPARKVHLLALLAMALELKVILCALEVDNLLKGHDEDLWLIFEQKRRELSFWRLVLNA